MIWWGPPLLILFFLSCKGGTEKALLPPSNGKVGSLLIVMDSVLWKKQLGRAFHQSFSKVFPGTPRAEPYFSVSSVDPRLFNRTLRRRDKIMVVCASDSPLRGNQKGSAMLKDEIKERIERDSLRSYIRLRDVYARGQLIWLWWGKEEVLAEEINKNAEAHIRSLEIWDRKELRKRLFVSEQKKLQEVLSKRHDIAPRIPFGYEVAKEEDQFVWLRSWSEDVDRNIFWHTEDYRNRDVFSRLPSYRDSLTSRFLVDGQKSSLYVIHQPEMPFSTQIVDFHGHYGLEIRGLWK
ncbi:MAG: DUF4837 family protein, partial [Cytophagales bacterium]|nr:DUF4837 family protein [Cytophagales bacterium]